MRLQGMRVWVWLAIGCRIAMACATGDEPVVAPIPVVQGESSRSPCEGRVVTVSGVVTASFSGLSGFFLQDPAGDGNPATSDGIFVFTGSGRDLPSAGSVVRVTGKVAEFARSGYDGSVTEIDTRAATTPLARVEILGAASPPRPAGLDTPLDGGDYLEAREGMLVAYPWASVVMPANSFNEYYALRFDRTPAGVRPTAEDPGGSPPLLIDRSGGAFRKNPKTFDLVPPLIGVLHFDFGAYRLEPLEDYVVDDGGWTDVPAPSMPLPYLSAASMNCQRFVRGDFPRPEDLDHKLNKLALAIRNELRSPDLVAVEEVGDLDLLAQLGARAGGYSAVLLAGCDFSGINVGLLYKTARVSAVTARQIQAEAPEFNKPACTLPDGRRFARPLLDRPSLLVDLTLDGPAYTIVVNHWRSQIGGRDEQRLAAARLVAQELTRINTVNVMVLGDFNDTENSESVRALADTTGLMNTTPLAPRESRYSLIFEGRSQALDHILLSPALAARRVASGYAHYNADFPTEPNSNNGTTPLRAADHDPPWLHLRR